MKGKALEATPLDRGREPSLGSKDDAFDHVTRHNTPNLREFHAPMQIPAVPDYCFDAAGDHQLIVPNPKRSGIQATRDVTSVTGVHEKVGKQIRSFIEGLLIHDEGHDTGEHLFIEDAFKAPWLCTIAKIASRNIRVFCIPVSELAGSYLMHELNKIKSSSLESATWHGKTRWWLSDTSTQISGEERVQRLVSHMIRSETKSHAFDSTARKKVPKHQKRHDHSLFRQLAQSFVPPRAEQSVISSNDSNHPVAGASRKVGVTATRDALQNDGFQTYDESISGAARDKKAVGRREVHGIKDLQHSNPDDSYSPGMVYTFVDQDMYINSFAKYAGANMVIITPEYNKLAGVGTDSTWYYTVAANGDVVVTERVATINGATYRNQRPWDYTANDFIFIEHLGNTAFTTYNVCIQFQPGSHHKWVWLARNTTTNLSKSICDMMCNVAQGSPLDGVTIQKANNVVVVKGESTVKEDTFLLGLFGDTADPQYSIKYAYDYGPHTSMELSEKQFRVFSLMGRNRPKGHGVSEVKRTLQMHSIWRPGGIEPLIVSFFVIPIEYRPQPNIMYTRQDGSIDDVVAEEGSATNGLPNAFGGGPGVADTKSDAAHEAYKKKRFEKYSNKNDPPQAFKEVVDMLLDRFIDQVSGETSIAKGSLVLCAPQVIFDRRTQALQAARLQRNAELVARTALPKTNLKHEVTAKASVAPRAITQFNEELAIQTGRVGILIKELLKHCGFFMPGGAPCDIALAIRHLTEMAMESFSEDEKCRVSGMHDTDYTKMDETISEYIYNTLFVKFVMSFVHSSDHDEVAKILADNVDFTAMLNGELYETGFKNPSGSGITTELNTFIAAFIEYVITCFAITKSTYRLRHGEELSFSDIKRRTVRTALVYYADNNDNAHIFWGAFMFRDRKPDIYSIPYAVIGPKFGDDGVGAHLPGISDADWGEAATFVTGTIGMLLKVSFSRPDEGTFFLGRHYPKPLESLASYADVAKACRKISVARNGDVEKYKLKLHGYWTTDSKTPGIREYLIVAARIYNVDLRRYEGIVELDDEDRPVLSKEMMDLLANDRDMFYRVAGGPYCVEDDDIPMMTEAITHQLDPGWPATEFEQWIDALSKCQTWQELDAFQIPGGDFDPDAEPECTVRMAGPAANLLAAGPSEMSDATGLTLEDLVTAAAVALQESISEA